MLSFQNCQVSVSGTPIVAENVTISESNSITPMYVFRYNGPIGTSPSGPMTNKIQINYLIETNNDPNFYIAQNIRNYNFEAFPIQIVVGGVTGAGYLSDYSLNISPNNLIKASVTYDVFDEVTGQIRNQPQGLNYNNLNNSGFAHYWTTYAKMGDESATGSLIQGGYAFNANWKPIYALSKYAGAGKPPAHHAPAQVKFINGQESFSFLSEYNLHVTYSGKDFEQVFTDIEMIEINNLSSEWSSQNNNSLKLFPASGKIVNNNTKFEIGNPILNETSIIKYY